MSAGWVLAIDTSTDLRVGLAHDGELVGTRAVQDTRAHAEQLMPTINDLLATAAVPMTSLDAVAVGLGPGPFTGLRVGIVTARTIAALNHVPLQGVCSLDIPALELVLSGSAPTEFVIVADARRKELYWAHYLHGHRVGGPSVSDPGALPDLPVAGPGSGLFAGVIGDRVIPAAPTEVDAGVLAVHVDRLPDAGLEPLYLRKPDATVPGARKPVIQRAQPRLTRRSHG